MQNSSMEKNAAPMASHMENGLHPENSPDSGAHSDLDSKGKHDMVEMPMDNPMKWPLWKKVYSSAVAWCFTFTLLNSLTCYAAAVAPVTMVFNVSMHKAILGFSLFLFGIAFAPIYTPHLSERIGRRFVYLYATIGMSAFLLGAAYSQTFTQLAVTRFFAGFLGGPIVVNVEGTFADLWDAKHTVTYYSFLAAAQYLGASVGPIICGPVIPQTDWRYSQFIPLIFAAASLLFSIAAPETFPRQIIRNEARRAGKSANLSPAASGATFGQMAKYTVFNPLLMLVSEPLVIGSTLMLGINFGLLFALFIAVPPVLMKVYMLDPYHQGLGFLSGLAGSLMALMTAPILEQLFRPLHVKRVGTMKSGVAAVEYRLVPAMLGSLFMIAGLFWIGNTASPKFHVIVPVAGTAVYVYGSLMVVISIVSYVFDAYPYPASILSALTAMACFRVFCGGIVSIYFLTSILTIGGPWSFSIFGILNAVMFFWPVFLFFFGPQIRSRSRYAKDDSQDLSPMMMEDKAGSGKV